MLCLSDSRTLTDAARGLWAGTYGAKKIARKGVLGGREVIRTRSWSVRRLAQQFRRIVHRKGDAAAEGLQGAYGTLIGMVEARWVQAEEVVHHPFAPRLEAIPDR